MDSKTLLLIPGIIYGIGLADLLKAFRPKIYWEITAMATILILNLIISWFLFSNMLSVAGENLGIFALTLVAPMLFTRACNVLTPEADVQDTREHYVKILKPFFLLLSAHVLVNILIQIFIQDDGLNIFRIFGIPLLIACAYFNKLWLRMIMMGIFAAIIIYIFSVYQLGYG